VPTQSSEVEPRPETRTEIPVEIPQIPEQPGTSTQSLPEAPSSSTGADPFLVGLGGFLVVLFVVVISVGTVFVRKRMAKEGIQGGRSKSFQTISFARQSSEHFAQSDAASVQISSKMGHYSTSYSQSEADESPADQRQPRTPFSFLPAFYTRNARKLFNEQPVYPVQKRQSNSESVGTSIEDTSLELREETRNGLAKLLNVFERKAKTTQPVQKELPVNPDSIEQSTFGENHSISNDLSKGAPGNSRYTVDSKKDSLMIGAAANDSSTFDCEEQDTSFVLGVNRPFASAVPSSTTESFASPLVRQSANSFPKNDWRSEASTVSRQTKGESVLSRQSYGNSAISQSQNSAVQQGMDNNQSNNDPQQSGFLSYFMGENSNLKNEPAENVTVQATNENKDGSQPEAQGGLLSYVTSYWN
jgi:hypothetical protein